MINIDPETGDASGVALKVLAGYRRERANILFGQFLALDTPLSTRSAASAPPSPTPPAAAGARSASQEQGYAGGGYIGGGGGGGDREARSTGVTGAEAAVDGARRRGMGSKEDAGGEEAKASPPSPASVVGGWKFWVSEGMEVAGET